MIKNFWNKSKYFILPLILFINFEVQFVSLHRYIPTFILSLMMFYAFFGIIFSIVKKYKRAIIITSIVTYIIITASLLKTAFSGEPFYFSDLFYYNDIGEILGIVKDTFFSKLLHALPFLIGQLFVVCVVIFISYKNDIEIKSLKKRLTIFIPCLLLLMIMYVPNKTINKFVLNCFYEHNTRKDYENSATTTYYYKRYGHLAGMYEVLLESRIFKSDNYDDNELNKELKNANEEKDKSLGKPNIIVVFSESFWDVDQLDGIKFDKPTTKNFNELKQEGLFFNMISPSFGGISANVEYEFLTGSSLTPYSNSFIPYMTLYNNSNYYNSPSIIKELKNNKYNTKLVSFASPNLFNCKNFYKYTKIDDVQFIENVDPKYIKGNYVSDEYVTDKIIKEFKNKKKDKKEFYMILTMQAHMPYNIDKYGNYDIDVVESKYDKELTDKLKSYAQGIYDANKQLGRLNEFIKEYDEPTIIIFYGDHLPYIEGLGNTKYFSTKDKKKDMYRKYNTQSLVLANYDISSLKEENKKIKYLSPDLLSTHVLNHMDIKLSNYYKWLNGTKNIIGASNRYVTIDQKGKIYYTKNLKGNMKKIYNLRENFQYKYFIK